MLREMSPIRQITNEGRRRWFVSVNCDLIVWLGDDEAVAGFQFCYDKRESEHALSWIPPAGFTHAKVDCGGPGSFGSGTPFLVPGTRFDPSRILAAFNAESAALPPEYVTVITGKLNELVETQGQVRT
ncbi:hypothetical protein [Usitatibacter palustris]|uniref:Uncharacterized protein n=1 Tax=Usitatibacter palustris TaxID=2732487 RepID=A0A6M4HDK0_9PROT|nr:hypothetical protein [Usitatibacter palustris]QJR16067.1 hypothetical protein DSM104440_02895 [Usitatibacter palustris]